MMLHIVVSPCSWGDSVRVYGHGDADGPCGVAERYSTGGDPQPCLLRDRICRGSRYRISIAFADSVDFLEDASVNFLILVALGWTAPRRARLGMALAGILLVPGLATVWTAWHKFLIPIAPAPVPLSLTGAGALAVNLSCALMLTHYRHHAGSLTRAAFLSARNDALANVSIIGAGLSTIHFKTAWPDLIVGLGIAVLNADAAREVYTTARAEHRTAVP